MGVAPGTVGATFRLRSVVRLVPTLIPAARSKLNRVSHDSPHGVRSLAMRLPCVLSIQIS